MSYCELLVPNSVKVHKRRERNGWKCISYP